MKAAIFKEPGNMSVQDVERPQIQAPHDAIIRVVRACVCGSDLWWYRGISDKAKGSQTGHEAIGIVEKVGSAVKNVQKGDFVIVPFTNGCGHCAACKAGFDGDCTTFTGGALGFQAEYLRYVSGDWGLVKIPGQPSDYSDDMLKSFTTLADVMATGYHAAVTAEVKPGDTVVVVGDGAVGLCGVIGAKLLGAERIIIMSRHKDRQELAIEFGATDIVAERGEEGIQRIMELTGEGADAILECVGSQLSVETAVQLARPGAVVGRVGIPHIDELDTKKLFWKNIGLRGGRAAVTSHDRAVLLDAVLEGRINPGKVFTMAFDLEDVQDAYAAMDERRAIKSLLVISD